MGKRKVLRPFIASFLACIMLLTFMTPVFAKRDERNSKARSMLETNKKVEEIMSEIISIIDKEIATDTSGIKIKNRDKILEDLESINFEALEALAEKQGIKYEDDLDEETLLRMFEIGINETNASIKKGKLKVLSDGALVEADDDNFYLQGGSTYDIRYWWGVVRYKSTDNARTWAAKIRSTGHVASLATLIFGYTPAGAITGLTALWAYNFADRVDYWNDSTSRGIIATIYVTLFFSIKTQ